jgi:hypothetical protein
MTVTGAPIRIAQTIAVCSSDKYAGELRATLPGPYTKNHNEMMPANRSSTAVINIASCIG